MSDTTPETGASPEPKTTIRIDQSDMVSAYAGVAMVSTTAEEFILDYAQGMRRSGDQNVIKIEQRIIMSPWAAKRLSGALNREVARYEQNFGVLDTDRARTVAATTAKEPED